jgi:alginate O-acetyltransferase complex protein AlgI
LVLERLGLAERISRAWKPLRHLYLLGVVMIGWVFFRADTLTEAVGFLRAMAGFGAGAPTPFAVTWYLTPALCLALVAGVIGSTPVVPALARSTERLLEAAPARAFALGVAASHAAMLALLLAASMLQIAAHTYNPFIYFRF